MPRDNRSRPAVDGAAQEIGGNQDLSPIVGQAVGQEQINADARRLHADYAVHLFPVGADKRPKGRWRKGEKDYVLDRQTTEELERWLRRKPKPPGWIGLCGGPSGWLCLDVEAAGMIDTTEKGELIRRVLDRFPASCQRATPSGGMHAWLKVTAGPARSGTYLVRRLNGTDEHGKRCTTLLAELRGHGQYALLVGFGRPPLAADFAPFAITASDVETLVEELRSVSDLVPVQRRRRERVERSAHPAPGARDWTANPPADTADVLAAAVAQGRMSWLDVLEDGWTEVGATTDGWSLWRRPDYGSETTAESSANGRELVGIPSLTVHSSSVPWAEPERSYSPAEVLTLSGRAGTVSFGDTMASVEAAARGLASGRKLAADHPLAGWDRVVLTGVYELLAKRDAEARRDRSSHRIGNVADFQDELIDMIGTGPLAGLFRRDDELVHVPRIGEGGYVALSPDDLNRGWDDGPAQVRTADPARLQFLVESVLYLVRQTSDAQGNVVVTHVKMPKGVAAGITSSPWGLPNLRSLRGVIHTPVFRADGTLVETEGYDDATAFLYLPTQPIPKTAEKPPPVVVEQAKALIETMLAGFRFVTEHDRANFWGALLLPFLIKIAPPPWPMVLISAPQTGAGKTLLTSLLLIVHGGVQRSAFPAEAEEARKQIATILYTTTATVVAFDNTEKTLRGNVLADLLTTAEKSDRLLGATQDIRLVNNRLWVANGNNITAGDDLARRLLWVTFDPGAEHPELLTFPIEDLAGWTREKRPELVAALLTLIRSWVAAGMPVEPYTRSDSFARTTAVMRGLLGHLGLVGTFQQRDRAPMSTDDQEWAEFLSAILREFGPRLITARQLVDSLHRIKDQLPEEIEIRWLNISRPLSAKSLGRFLTNRVDRWCGGHVLRSTRDRSNLLVYRVETAGFVGFDPHLLPEENPETSTAKPSLERNGFTQPAGGSGLGSTPVPDHANPARPPRNGSTAAGSLCGDCSLPLTTRADPSCSCPEVHR